MELTIYIDVSGTLLNLIHIGEYLEAKLWPHLFLG